MKNKSLFVISAFFILLLTVLADMRFTVLSAGLYIHVLGVRLLIFVPALLFIAILYYLLQQKEKNSYLKNRKEYLNKLRAQEKIDFEHMYQTWQESRRIRHDVRHMALLFKEYLHQGNTKELRRLLLELQKKAGDSHDHPTTGNMRR